MSDGDTEYLKPGMTRSDFHFRKLTLNANWGTD